MESSNPKVYDPFRKKWIIPRPEELIRIALLEKMVSHLSYPLSSIAIELSLNALPHLSSLEKQKVPPRRLDIVVFAKNIHPKYEMFPLLLLECKVEPLNEKNSNQLIGYNDIVKAPFIALANQYSQLTGQYDERFQSFTFQEGLFSFDQLISKL